MTMHYHPEAADRIAKAYGNIYGKTVASCGAYLSNARAAAQLTSDAERVTCKRCAKTLETGSADTGVLAGASASVRASILAAKAAR